MKVPSSAQSLEALKAPLARWFGSRAPDVGPIHIESLAANQNGAGLSNLTLIVTAQHTQGRSKWVIRCAHDDPDSAICPDNDIPGQFRVMDALHRRSNIPVTAPLWLETESSLLGSPFFVMDFIDGDVPADNPPWQTAGFLVDGTDADRARVWWSTVEHISRIGKIDWQAAGLGFLEHAVNGGASLSAQVDYFERWFWAARVNCVPFPEAERAIAWLRANMPAHPEMGLVWGDAKPGNVIFRGYEPVALMDWELTGLGPPEMDLANFLVYQVSHETTINPAHARPRLPGFGTNAETMARFEQLIGRPLRDFNFYWVFTAFRYLTLAQRYCNLLVKMGAMSSETAEAIKLLGGSMTRPMMLIVDGLGSPASI